MVLEEATASNEPFQQQDSPSSDIDPYSGDRNPTVLPSRDSSFILVAPGIYINWNNVPHPILTPGFAMGPYRQAFASSMQKFCAHTSKIIRRPIRQEEAEALAFHQAKAARTSSFAPVLGMGVGAAVTYYGRDKLRFPGWTPDPNKYSIDKFLRFKGSEARFLWNVLRFTSYSAVAAVLGGMFVTGPYAGMVASVGIAMDSRLKEYNEKLREWAKDRKGALPRLDETPGQREGETFDMARQRRIAQRTQQAGRSKKDDFDDMSPTGGSFGDEFLDTGSSSDSGLMSDSQSQIAQQSGRQAESAQRAPSRQFGDNDASLTPRHDPSSKQSGSAWDRLRQQAISGQGQSSPPRASRSAPAEVDGSSSLDSFAFSNADEDRQLARSEARKQFDARIERERAGKDFGEQGGKGGWRR